MDLRRFCCRIAIFSVTFSSLACGAERFIVIGTASAPSTSGYVEIENRSAHATKIRVHMEQLHPVDSVDPALHAYVVWLEDGRATPIRAGSLKYRPDDRIGELKVTSPYRKFVVKITAEANDSPSNPSAFVVASEAITAPE
jgi:hypothetical protein